MLLSHILKARTLLLAHIGSTGIFCKTEFADLYVKRWTLLWLWKTFDWLSRLQANFLDVIPNINLENDGDVDSRREMAQLMRCTTRLMLATYLPATVSSSSMLAASAMIIQVCALRELPPMLFATDPLCSASYKCIVFTLLPLPMHVKTKLVWIFPGPGVTRVPIFSSICQSSVGWTLWTEGT